MHASQGKTRCASLRPRMQRSLEAEVGDDGLHIGRGREERLMLAHPGLECGIRDGHLQSVLGAAGAAVAKAPLHDLDRDVLQLELNYGCGQESLNGHVAGGFDNHLVRVRPEHVHVGGGTNGGADDAPFRS